jgi:hypothetical protein
LAQDSSLSGILIGVGQEEAAANISIAMAKNGRLDGRQAKRILADLKELPPWSDYWANAAYVERLMTLEAGHMMVTGDAASEIAKTFGSKLNLRQVDADLMLRHLNAWHDRTESIQPETGQIAWDIGMARSREEAVETLREEWEESTSLRWRFEHVLKTPRAKIEATTRHAANTILRVTESSQFPFRQYTRVLMKADLAQVAVALAAHRAEHKSFPETLSELAPAYLSELPCDRFSGRPLRYRREADGYIVYSVGANLKDDGGTTEEDEFGEADLVVQVP